MGVQPWVASMVLGKSGILRIDVLPILGSGLVDSRANALMKALPEPLGSRITAMRTSLGYSIKGEYSEGEAKQLATDLFPIQ